MSVQGNVIHFEPAVWYCMRQCRESISHLKSKNNPIYDIEIKGEQEILNTFMDQVLKRKAA